MSVPADPAGFVAAAERGINQRDLDATVAPYAAGARLEALTDGAREVYTGAGAIRAAWSGYLAAMEEREFRLAKRLLCAHGDLLVNDWTGGLGARTQARGMEYWRFDVDGRVAEHRMYSFLDVRPSTSPVQRLRVAAAYPVSALALLRAQRRAGARPGH